MINKIIIEQNGAVIAEYAIITAIVSLVLLTTLVNIADSNIFSNYLDAVSETFLSSLELNDIVKIGNLYDRY